MRETLLVVVGIVTSATLATAAPDTGFLLRKADLGASLVDKTEHVRMVGVDAKGKLLDYGDFDKKLAMSDGRLTGLSKGKPTTGADTVPVAGEFPVANR